MEIVLMEKSTRRRFLQAAAATAAAPLAAVPAAVQAGEPPASAEEALAGIVRLRFKHLTEDQFKAVQRKLRGVLAAGEVLKRTRLDPTDEPATIFVVDVAG
jgi:hypothetical protein